MGIEFVTTSSPASYREHSRERKAPFRGSNVRFESIPTRVLLAPSEGPRIPTVAPVFVSRKTAQCLSLHVIVRRTGICVGIRGRERSDSDSHRHTSGACACSRGNTCGRSRWKTCGHSHNSLARDLERESVRGLAGAFAGARVGTRGSSCWCLRGTSCAALRNARAGHRVASHLGACLLYTSDAADE